MALKLYLLRALIRQSKHTHFIPLAYCCHHHHYDQHTTNILNRKVVGAALFGSVLIGTALNEKKKKHKSKNNKSDGAFNAGDKIPDLPTYRAEEVSEHDTKDSFWVTYRHGVYDMTSFLASHPGGEQIFNAAGLSVEPFWNVYGVHKTKQVFELLESHRIGNLHDDDIVDHSDEELWAKEPARSDKFIVRVKRPFNAEIDPKNQIDYFDTPNYLFYVRHHMPVPEIDATTHTVTVTVIGDEQVCETIFSLDQLSQFPRARVRAALMCAGNRRSEMTKAVPDKEVKGISWAGGAISNAVWEGVWLRDVLKYSGVDLEDTEGKHVILEGSDTDATGTRFSTSIPLYTAVRTGLLATDMNGTPLTREHGAPVRAVLPGAPAVRSVKWLRSISISKEESQSHWHQRDYRSFNPSVEWSTANFPDAPPVYSLPVTSAVCEPTDGDCVVVKDGAVRVRGYAYSGGGAKIVRVDVSPDHGRSWLAASPVAQDDAPHGEHYSWMLWTVTIPVTEEQDELDIWVKATDGNFNTQPEHFRDIWNIRGILSNGYHKISVGLTHE